MTKMRRHFFGKMVAVFASMFVFNATASDWTYYPGVNILTDGTFGFTASVIDGTTNHLNVTAHIATYSNNTHSASLDLKNGTISDASGNSYEIKKWDVSFDSANLTAVSLPPTIDTMTGTFSQCLSIKEFNFTSQGVSSVPECFLYRCSGITNGVLYLPNVTSIGNQAFQLVRKWDLPITNVLNLGATRIGSYAFSDNSFVGDVVVTNWSDRTDSLNTFNNSSASSINISSDTRTRLNDYQFANMSKVKCIRLNFTKLKSICQSVFYSSSATNNVAELNLSNVTTLNQYALRDTYLTGNLAMTNLTGKSIPTQAFANCKFKSIYLSNTNCTSIETSAFSGLRSVTNIVLDLPNCTSVGSWAFAYCTATNDISCVLPQKVSSIGYDAYFDADFTGCADLKLLKTLSTKVFYDSAIEEVVFGSGVSTFQTDLGQFGSCGRLGNVTFDNVDIDLIAGKNSKINPTLTGGMFASCAAISNVTFIGAAPTNCVDEASGTNLVTNGRLFIDAILCSAQWSTNSANAYKNVCIYANPTNGWSNYAQPIDPAIDGPAPEDAYGVYVTAAGNRKAWLCQERGWTYNPTRRLLTDGRWGFTASVISGTNLNVTGHHADYTNTVQSGILDLKDKTITGTDGKTYSIQQWSVKFTQSHPVSKIVLPSTIKNVTGTFTSCTNLQEFVFESDLVDNLPSGFITSCSILSNGVVRLPNLTTIRGNAFRLNGNFSMPITNVVHKNLKSLGSGAFRASAMTGDVVITNLQDTVFGAYTFNLARNVTSIDITAPNMYNFSLHAFDNMSSCTSIVLTTSARTMLGAQCFQNDIAYNDISDVLTPYVYYLGDYTFDNTKFTGDADLTSITTLSKGAFRSSSISSATFSKNMESFNCVETFANSKSLRELTFNDCDIDLATASTTIDLDGTTGPFYNCSNIVSVTFRGGSPSNSTDVVTNGRKFLDALVASGVATKDQTDSKKSIVFYAESNKGWKDFASPLTAEDGEAPDFCYGVYVTTAGERKAYMVRRPKQFIILFR